MRKFMTWICVAVFCFTISGCGFDPYYGKRPFDYGEAKWTCDAPLAWFIVDPYADDYDSPTGVVQVNNQTIQFRLIFVHETNLVFFQTIDAGTAEYNNAELTGECVFSSTKFTIKVDTKTDSIFNGQYEELVFKKTLAEQ